MSVLDLIRSDLKSVQPYTQGNDKSDCRLHMNELPWSPIESPGIALNHYPTMDAQNQLQERLANRYQVPPSALLLTRGSDEGIDLLMRLFLQPGVDSILQCPPTFSMYAFYARLQQVTVIDCPLNDADRFYLSIQSMHEQWQPNCKLIMLCRPNNPTANLIELETVAQLCQYYQDRSMIVVDEAYIEFSDAMSAAHLVDQFDNLIVLRTLSKAYGLAGLRLGAVIAQPSMISALKTIVAPFTLSSAVIDLGIRALQNDTWFEKAIQQIKTSRTRLMTGLQQSIWIESVYPSDANFILIKTRFSHALYMYLESLGIAVRRFTQASDLQQHLRITIGSEAQNQRVLAALESFRGEQ
jgi:histidinol-phosphate aminotransferase